MKEGILPTHDSNGNLYDWNQHIVKPESFEDNNRSYKEPILGDVRTLREYEDGYGLRYGNLYFSSETVHDWTEYRFAPLGIETCVFMRDTVPTVGELLAIFMYSKLELPEDIENIQVVRLIRTSSIDETARTIDFSILISVKKVMK